MKRFRWSGFVLIVGIAGCFALAACNREAVPGGAQDVAEGATPAAEAPEPAGQPAPGAAPANLAKPTAPAATAPARQQPPVSSEARPEAAPSPAVGSRNVSAAAPPAPPAPPPPPPPVQVTLAAGTPLVVRTTNALTTKTVKTGQEFTATLEEPLMDGMTMIAPKGATVRGVVANSDPGGRVKGVASLSLRLKRLETELGGPVEIETDVVGFEAGKSTKKDALKVGIGSGIGAAIGAIAGGGKGAAIGAGVGAGAGTAGVLATRGQAAEVPAETILQFKLDSPVTITETKR